MDLPIQAHGVLIPEGPWEGRVVSLYSRALNVLHPQGLLIGMVAAPQQMSPFSLLVERLFSAEAAGSPAGRVTTGVLCRRTDTDLRIAGLRLELASSLPWDGRLEHGLGGSVVEPASMALLLRTALETAGAEGGLREVVVRGPTQTIFGRRAREILEKAHAADGDRPVRLVGLSSLVGLGIGFTPSGDDFISGVMLAREMVSSAPAEIETGEIRSSLGRTNDGGRTLLTAVLAHCYPAYLLDFAAAIAEASKHSSTTDAAARAVTEAVRSAAAHGETSGTDAVAGFAWYLGLVAG